jgi:hypothetical protein
VEEEHGVHESKHACLNPRLLIVACMQMSLNARQLTDFGLMHADSFSSCDPPSVNAETLRLPVLTI